MNTKDLILSLLLIFSHQIEFGTCQQHGGGIGGAGGNNMIGGAGGSIHHTPLPGVEGRPGSTGSRLNCMKESNAVLVNTEVHNEMSKLHTEVATLDISSVCTKLETPENAVVSGERYDCILDFEQEFGVGLKSACISNNGTFVERTTKVHCIGQETPDKGQDAPTYTWEFLNFPICSGTDCNEGDIDRLLNRNVIQVESALQAHLNHAVCRGDAFGQAAPSGTDDLHDWIKTEEHANAAAVEEQKEVLEDVLSNNVDSENNEETSGAAGVNAAFPSSSVIAAMMSFMTLVYYSW